MTKSVWAIYSGYEVDIPTFARFLHDFPDLEDYFTNVENDSAESDSGPAEGDKSPDKGPSKDEESAEKLYSVYCAWRQDLSKWDRGRALPVLPSGEPTTMCEEIEDEDVSTFFFSTRYIDFESDEQLYDPDHPDYDEHANETEDDEAILDTFIQFLERKGGTLTRDMLQVSRIATPNSIQAWQLVMDTISKFEDTEILKVLVPTFAAFIPLLEEKRTQITSIPKRTFTYGDTPRHQLDVYYPPSSASSNSPILFFIYGGGFTTGERTLPAPADLSYANVAAYYALRGFITIIPDYRLVPHVKFPGQPEDVRDALKWVVENINSQSVDVALPQADTASIFFMGHSAGAAHISVMILLPGLMPLDLKRRVKGLVLMSGTYHNFPSDLKSDFVDLIGTYWANEEEVKKKDPLPLLNALPDEEAVNLPPILLVEGTREPEWLLVVGKDFYEAARQKAGVRVERLVAEGHNHISVTLAPTSGQGEEWAEKSAAWMQRVLA